MSPQNDPMELALAELGRAHQAGAFVGRPARYPWQAAAGQFTGTGQRRFDWMRVGLPLAAAAAVAVLFLGPSLFGPKATRRIARTIPVTAHVSSPQAVAEAPPLLSPQEVPSCDYNGDGVVDGRDIQAFVDRLKRIGGDDAAKRSEFLQRCLIGG